MTVRQALRIALQEMGKSVRGTGCGIREELSEERRSRAIAAAKVLWPKVYGRPFDDSDLFNYF